jgi:glycerol-3-phosphate dehydrogenase
MVLPASNRVRFMTLKAAVATYDRLGSVAPSDTHQTWKRRRLSEEEPIFRFDKFPLAVAYREYLTDDARLVLANLRAAARHGAVVVNRVRAVGLSRAADGTATGVVARDALEGSEFEISARVVINAAGPWLDSVLQLEDAQRGPSLTLTKGVHVVIPRAQLPIDNMWVMNGRDNRPLFAIPRGPVVYLGTTDTEHTGGPRVWPRITTTDVDYLLEAVPKMFRIDPLSRAHVVAAWAGLRALVAEPGKRPSEVSRQDAVATGTAGVVSIAGGKLTGYRTVARDVFRVIAQRLDFHSDADDQEDPLPGGDFGGDIQTLGANLARAHGLPIETAVRLARLYGAEAERVIAAGATTVGPGVPVLSGEIAWAVEHEGALTLEDVFYRRTRHALYDPSGSLALAPMAEALAARLGWDDARTQSELAEVGQRFASDLDFQDAAPHVEHDDYEKVIA